jgi:hypothetical protein
LEKKLQNSSSSTETKQQHTNELASTLLEGEEPRRLKRFKPADLRTRFS